MRAPKARTVLAVIAVIGYIMITIGFYVLLFNGSKVELPEGDLGKAIIGMLGQVVGTWTALITLAFTFSFSTSQSSSDKNELVKKALELGNKPEDKP
jgi:NADH:ubiquinone oxidoreductase subunit 6 (subunit J)